MQLIANFIKQGVPLKKFSFCLKKEKRRKPKLLSPWKL